MRSASPVVTCLLFSMAAFSIAILPAGAEDLLKAARDAHASRHLELAAKRYQQVIDQGGDSVYLAKLGLASVWAQMGRYDDAIDLYLATEKGDYHWSGAGSLPMAEAARNAGLQEKLVPAYEAICARDNYRDAFGWMHKLYLDTGNLAKANDVAAKQQWPAVPLHGDFRIDLAEADRLAYDDARQVTVIVNNLKDAAVTLGGKRFSVKTEQGKPICEGGIPKTDLPPKGVARVVLPVTLKGATGRAVLTTDIDPAWKAIICIVPAANRSKAVRIKVSDFRSLDLKPGDAAVLAGGEMLQLTYIPSGGVFREGRAYCANVPEAYAEFIVDLDAPMKVTSYTEWANTTFHGTQTRLLINGRVVVDDVRAINWPERREPSFWLQKGRNTIRLALCYQKPDGQQTFLKLVWLNIRPLFDDVLDGNLGLAGEDVYFYKGGQKTFRLHLSNLLNRDVSYKADVEVRSDRGRVFAKQSRELALKANADADLDLPLAIEAAGLLAAEVSLHTSRGVMMISQDFCSLHEIPIEYDYDSPLILSWYVDNPNASLLAERAAKVGYRWTSDEIWWYRMEPEKQGQFAWEQYDRRAELARKYKTYVIPITGGCPPWANLWHGQTPDEFKRQRAAWMVDTKRFDWYESYVTAFVNRYGDIAKAIRIWNEPWEGGGISGWSGRGDLMQQYIIAARKAIGKSNYKDCLVMSNDSVFNYQDNLEWSQEASDAIGVGSDHPYGGLVALQLESGPYFARLGKPCWNTESWDRLDWPIKSVCIEQSLGVSKSCPHEAGHLMKASTGICQANALLRFSYHAKFDRQINPHCMPWMFAFKAKDEQGRNFAVVFGRIDNARRYGYVWDQIAGDGTLTVADRGRKFSVFDCYGNPVDAGTRRKQIPLNNDPYFITTTGELDELVAALQDAEAGGITPVQVGVYDITRPFNQAPVLKVELQNACNVPLSGTIAVKTPADLRLKSDTLKFRDLVPGKRTVFELPIERGTPNAANRYPITVTVKTPRGECSLDETISLALIKRGTPAIDGDLAEWEKLGAVPVYVTPKGSSLPASEAMRLLMWTAAQAGEVNLNGKNAAKVAAMYDDKNFYVMAQVLDGRERKSDRNHARVSMRGDWYKMQKPPADILYAFGPVFPGGMFQIAFDCIPPDARREYYPPDSPFYRHVSFFDTDYEFSIYETMDRGPEVWCNMAPGMRYDNAYPYTPKAEIHQDVVGDAKAAVVHDDEMRIWKYECAIPLSRIAGLKPQPGATARFNFLIKCVGHWAEGRSTCVLNRCTFHPSWEPHYSNDVEWGFVE